MDSRFRWNDSAFAGRIIAGHQEKEMKSIKKRTYIYLAIIFVYVIAIFAIVFYYQHESKRVINYYFFRNYNNVVKMQSLKNAVLETDDAIWHFILQRDKKWLSAWKMHQSQYFNLYSSLSTAAKDKLIQKEFTKINELFSELLLVHNDIIEKGDLREALYDNSLLHALISRSDIVINQYSAVFARQKQTFEEMNRELKLQSLLVTILFIIIISVSRISFIRFIYKPISAFLDYLKKDKLDDFEPVLLKTDNEISIIASRFNEVLAKLKKREIELKDLAERDEMTGLFNYRRFKGTIELEVKRSKRNKMI